MAEEKKVTEEIKEAVEEKTEEVAEAAEEAKEAAEEVKEAAEEKPAMKASTEANRRKKAERRDAKAARKEANKIEEKKKRPSNLLLAIMIFGVLILMVAFVKGYNYFSQPASIEKYFEENGYNETYTDIPVSEYTTVKVRAEKNMIKVLFTVSEDATEEELDQYRGDDGTEYLKEIGASFLTSIKPEVQGFGGSVKVGVKQGDTTINYVKMSYSEAKKFVKEQEEEAEAEAEEAEEADEAGEDAEADAEAEEVDD